MKKPMILFAVIVALVIGVCVWNSIRKEALCSVVYSSHIGYSLSMRLSDETVTVTYAEQGKEPIIRNVDKSCYTNIVSILDACDFPSWRKLSDKSAQDAALDMLEIQYGKKIYYFSLSQDLPPKAQELFSLTNSCLLEYAGICK